MVEVTLVDVFPSLAGATAAEVPIRAFANVGIGQCQVDVSAEDEGRLLERLGPPELRAVFHKLMFPFIGSTLPIGGVHHTLDYWCQARKLPLWLRASGENSKHPEEMRRMVAVRNF